MSKLVLAIIHMYQITLSPLLGSQCRYEPSCSRYWADAVREHGSARGSWMGCKRLLRCHPFRAGGYDPVPKAQPKA